MNEQTGNKLALCLISALLRCLASGYKNQCILVSGIGAYFLFIYIYIYIFVVYIAAVSISHSIYVE
jgi:hypothetical protein